jgi:hypothetical protein
MINPKCGLMGIDEGARVFAATRHGKYPFKIERYVNEKWICYLCGELHYSTDPY